MWWAYQHSFTLLSEWRRWKRKQGLSAPINNGRRSSVKCPSFKTYSWLQQTLIQTNIYWNYLLFGESSDRLLYLVGWQQICWAGGKETKSWNLSSFIIHLLWNRTRKPMILGARNLIQQRMKTAAHNIALLSGPANSFKNHEVHPGTVP